MALEQLTETYPPRAIRTTAAWRGEHRHTESFLFIDQGSAMVYRTAISAEHGKLRALDTIWWQMEDAALEIVAKLATRTVVLVDTKTLYKCDKRRIVKLMGNTQPVCVNADMLLGVLRSLTVTKPVLKQAKGDNLAPVQVWERGGALLAIVMPIACK